MCAIISMDLKTIMVNERSQMQKITRCMIPFIWNIGKSIETLGRWVNFGDKDETKINYK